MDEWLEGYAREAATPGDEGADPLGSEELVGRRTDEVNPRVLELSGLLPEALRGIDVEVGLPR